MSTKFKLIDSWKDTYFNIENRVYQTKDGLKLLFSLNKNSQDFDFSVVIKGGSFYEVQLNAPAGTAHFLEHAICGEPNKKFPSLTELNEFTYGTRYRPKFSYGAATSKKFIYFYAHGNKKAQKRIIDFIFAEIDIPLNEEYVNIEKQKRIILAEFSRRYKEERDEGLQLSKFKIGEVYPELIIDNLGNTESIKSINLEILKNYFNEVFTTDNVVLTIQAPEELTESQFNNLYRFNKILINKNTKLKTPIRTIPITFKYKHFKNEDLKSVFFSVNRLLPAESGVLKDYKTDRLRGLVLNILWKSLNDYLREELNLIYSVEMFNGGEAFEYMGKGYKIECEIENLLKVFNGIDYVYETFTEEFLKSNKGKKWFEDILSNYVFKNNSEVDPDYAETLGVDLLSNTLSKYDFFKARKVIFDLTIEDLLKFFKKFINIPPIFWFVSPFEEEEIYSIFKKSKLYKRYSNK